MKWFKKGILFVGIALLVVIALSIILYFVFDEPRPEGREGPEADALASRLERAVNIEAWNRTGAVQWTFSQRNTHLWDRQRNVVRVRTGDEEVLLRTDDRTGRAYRSGAEVQGEDATALVERAYAAWVNDSFWLNPLAMFHGEGISRSLVRLDDGTNGLLIAFTSGGLTPGDAYLWIPGDDDFPRAWKMWVSIIPIGGIEIGWSDWQRLNTGALISTRHELPLGLSLVLSDVSGAETLDELHPGPDPFGPLFEN